MHIGWWEGLGKLRAWPGASVMATTDSTQVFDDPKYITVGLSNGDYNTPTALDQVPQSENLVGQDENRVEE